MIYTYSSFIYGHTITTDNRYLDFQEDGDALTAIIPIGSYSFTKFLDTLVDALNDAGSLTYSYSVDRSTRIVTIESTGPFTFLGASGDNAGQSILELLGFALSDLASTDNKLIGSVASGFVYEPQFKLQSYVSTDDSKKLGSATVSQSASGNVSIQTFGNVSFMECDIQFATDIAQPSIGPIKNNSNGHGDLVNFMSYLITKAPIEFLADIDDSDTYETFILESSPDYGDGTGFKLRERYDKGYCGYYDTGTLKFRTITE